MEVLKKVSSAVHTVGAICLGFTFVSVVINVILRIFGTSLGSWVEEMSGYAVVWATYLGMAYVLRENKHVRVDLLTEKLPLKAQAVVRILSDLVTLAFTAIVVVYSIKLTQLAYVSERVTQLSGFPYYILLIMMPVGMILFGLETIGDMAVMARKLVSGQVDKVNEGASTEAIDNFY